MGLERRHRQGLSLRPLPEHARLPARLPQRRTAQLARPGAPGRQGPRRRSAGAAPGGPPGQVPGRIPRARRQGTLALGARPRPGHRLDARGPAAPRHRHPYRHHRLQADRGPAARARTAAQPGPARGPHRQLELGHRKRQPVVVGRALSDRRPAAGHAAAAVPAPARAVRAGLVRAAAPGLPAHARQRRPLRPGAGDAAPGRRAPARGGARRGHARSRRTGGAPGRRDPRRHRTDPRRRDLALAQRPAQPHRRGRPHRRLRAAHRHRRAAVDRRELPHPRHRTRYAAHARPHLAALRR